MDAPSHLDLVHQKTLCCSPEFRFTNDLITPDLVVTSRDGLRKQYNGFRSQNSVEM